MGYRLTKIYTRSGDDGKTNLGTSERFKKNHPRIEALGNLDELNCALGVVLSQNDAIPLSIKHGLTQIQNELFDIGGELCPPYRVVITLEHITALEKKIDEWNSDLPPLKEFILPGGNFPTATCHLARAICRRAERALVSLHQEEPLNPEILRYINRLSDFLFVMARILAKESGQIDTLWQQGKNRED